MKVAILGYSIEGKSAAEYWHSNGNEVTICDQNIETETPDWSKTKLGNDYLNNLNEFELIVRSPGIAPKKITAANPDLPNILDKVTTTINEFFANCTKPIIGVTGTKGKGTTSTLISKILENSGKNVFLGGNIGIPVLGYLSELTDNTVVVLELSSFQLIDFKYRPNIGVCLLVAPEHLDWHSDLAEYYNAKKNLFAKQSGEDLTIFNANNSESTDITSVSEGKKIPYFVTNENIDVTNKNGAYVENDTIYYQQTPVCKTSEVGLLGRHNLENVCAAIAATWQITSGNVMAMQKAISEFKGMEHRLEFVRELNGIEYYNDSFATTPIATIAAIKAFSKPKVVILGGSDKGADFNELAKVVAENNVRQTIVIGDTGEKIIEALVKNGYNNIILGGTSLQEAINTARKAATRGDVVLLSTACASFGMFSDYKGRGNRFKELVNELS